MGYKLSYGTKLFLVHVLSSKLSSFLCILYSHVVHQDSSSKWDKKQLGNGLLHSCGSLIFIYVSFHRSKCMFFPLTHCTDQFFSVKSLYETVCLPSAQQDLLTRTNPPSQNSRFSCEVKLTSCPLTSSSVPIVKLPWTVTESACAPRTDTVFPDENTLKATE